MLILSCALGRPILIGNVPGTIEVTVLAVKDGQVKIGLGSTRDGIGREVSLVVCGAAPTVPADNENKS